MYDFKIPLYEVNGKYTDHEQKIIDSVKNGNSFELFGSKYIVTETESERFCGLGFFSRHMNKTTVTVRRLIDVNYPKKGE